MNTHDIKLPPLTEPAHSRLVDGIPTITMAEHTDIARQYARATAEPYRKALHDLIRDLEMRSNLKRGDDKGDVDCGNGVYRQALMALGELE